MTSADDARAVADVAAQQARIKAEVVANLQAERRYRVVACETCLDRGRVQRIHGGASIEEWCPEGCGDDEPDPIWGEWNNWTELLDDMRKDDR